VSNEGHVFFCMHNVQVCIVTIAEDVKHFLLESVQHTSSYGQNTHVCLAMQFLILVQPSQR
jgi:hypothetical protein